MKLLMSGEDYLEAIYVLHQRMDVVHSIDVARHLKFSKPSVSRAVGTLRAGGYLTMQPGGALELTEKGLETARNIYERHTVLTALFTSLGVDEKTAAEDACRVEHALSEETFTQLKAMYAGRLLNEPPAVPEEAAKSEKKGGKKKGEKKKKKTKEDD